MKFGRRHMLLLCWRHQEAKRLCGGALTIYPYHGGGRKKDPAFLAKFDIVVTTYGVVQVHKYHIFCKKHF